METQTWAQLILCNSTARTAHLLRFSIGIVMSRGTLQPHAPEPAVPTCLGCQHEDARQLFHAAAAVPKVKAASGCASAAQLVEPLFQVIEHLCWLHMRLSRWNIQQSNFSCIDGVRPTQLVAGDHGEMSTTSTRESMCTAPANAVYVCHAEVSVYTDKTPLCAGQQQQRGIQDQRRCKSGDLRFCRTVITSPPCC